MKPALTHIAALLLPLAVLQAKDQVTNAPAIGDVHDVRVVRTADQEPRASLLGQPSIALWKEKHLVVAYQKGIAGKGDMGSIDAIVSSNDGDSWSIPSTIFDHEQRHGALQFAYCNAVLYHPPGQEVLWCFAMRCPLNYADSEDSHLAAAYSGDGGRSWNPVELAMHYTGPLVILGEIQRIVENGQPVYLLPAHRNTKRADPLGQREHFVLRSTSLLDWSLGGYVPQPEPGKIFLHEGQIAVINEQQHLKMVMRTSVGRKEGGLLDGGALNPPRAWSSTSTDGGKTWSVAQEESDLWNTVSEGWFGQSRTGTQLYVYNDGPAFSRMALRYKAKPATGAWSDEHTFSTLASTTPIPRSSKQRPASSAPCGTAVTKNGTAARFALGSSLSITNMKPTLSLLTALLLAPLAALHAAEPVTIDLAKRTWQGIPGLERTAKGRVFVSWFTGGTKEPEPENTVALSHSDDGGKTFSAPQAMGLPLSDGTRCYDPCLWMDPKGRLWYLFNRSVKDSTQHGVYARICDAPDASPPVWGAEFRVGFDGPFSFRMNKPVVLSTGEWALPVVHALEPLAAWAGFDPKQVFGAAISTDEGKTWKLHGAIKTAKAGLENMIVELKDGRLWMLIRTEKVLWESYSSDKGRTWTPGKPTSIATPHSRFFIRRLASGNLLLVNHYKFTGRSHLTAQLSTDDGATWNDGLLLDERSGVSYPDGVQAKDGLIWITYDRDRGGAGEILLAKFKEDDVTAGRNVSGAVSLKQVVNKLNKPTIPSKPAVKVTQELLNSIHVTPKLIFDPMPAYAQKYLPFAMAASMESTQKGRLWTCWAGGQDGPNAYLLASYSDDQGKSWRDPVFVIDPQAQGLKMGTRLGSFWCDPKGRLWLFFHQSVGMFDGSCSNWFVRCDDPDAEKPVWTQPVYIGFGASLNKPIVSKNGEWILPVSLWERWHIDKPFADCYHELDAVRGSNVFVSDDEGGHWRYRGGNIFKDSCFNEHTVAELNDGRLWMLSRGMKETFQSFSTDGGKTWQPQSTAFPHVNSKAVIRRLQSGHLLVIRHGQDITKATPKRQELTAFLSTDDGKTWSGKLLLDERDNVSYPDIAQAPNGDIYVHYDRERTGAAEILFARFREEDVQAGKLISKDAALKNLVKSKLGMNHGSSGK